LKIRPAI